MTGCAAATNNSKVSKENCVTVEDTAEVSLGTIAPMPSSEEYMGEMVDVIEFSKDMDNYSINLSCDVYFVEKVNSYRLDVNDDNVTVCSGGDVVSSIVFNNPYVGGAPFAGINDYKRITAEVLEFETGNLLIVRVPVEIVEDKNAQCLSFYYFDNSFVNYIGKRIGGGDFWPLIDGTITVDGNTFTVNEYEGSERKKRIVTYSVDFENILIKEVTG